MITVILENQPPIYPGTVLQGHVICNFEKDTTVRSIKIRCYGKEHTEWRGNSKNNPRYEGNHYFFQMETKLFEPENSSMKSGTYKYPYTFLLPHSLPSVLDMPYGYIRYSLKGIIDIPLAIDPRHRLDINLISVLDIATLPSNLRQPTQVSQESLMGCCLFFNTDPIQINAQLNKLVFLPGETIKINMEVSNMSSDNVQDITIKLLRCFVAHSETPRHDVRYVNEDILMVKLEGLGAHAQRTYDADLHIPTDIAIPNMIETQLIQIFYRIMVTGTTSGFGRNLDVPIAELSMGHVDGGNWNQNSVAVSQPLPYTSGYPYPSAPEKHKVAMGEL